MKAGNVVITLTAAEVRSIFSAVNTAGMLSSGRVVERDSLEGPLVSAVEKLESASGLHAEDVDEWTLA